MQPVNDKQLEPLLKSVDKAASTIKTFVENGLHIRVFCHLDADGIAAGGIIGRALDRLGADFRIRVERQLSDPLVKSIGLEGSSPCIFTDFGSGYLDLLREHMSGTEIIVLDHHEPVGESFTGMEHANPHLFGFDGAREVSGSGMAYFAVKNLDPKNVDLAPIAVVGALGDLQDKNDEHELRGLNALIVEDGIKADVLQVEKDLLFFGRETRPVHKALSLTTDPFIPGLSGHEDKCLGFLVNLGLQLKDGSRWRPLSELSKDEKQLLFSKLTEYMISSGSSGSSALRLIGNVYILLQEDKSTFLRDAREFSSILNACARTKKTGLALAISIGDRLSTLPEAETASNEYRRTLAEYLDKVTTEKGRIMETESCYILRGDGVIDERMLGSVSSILVTSGILSPSKPLISLALTEEGMVKVSARADDSLLVKNLNLGNIMQKAAESVDGMGGGHDVAAGALLQRGREDAFLNAARQLLKEVLD